MPFGRLVPVKDVPGRTERLPNELDRRGLVPKMPAEHGTAPALGVHASACLRFLETTWERWAGLPDHGSEVWANTSPHRSGRAEEAARPGCPAEGLVGRVVWYLGDLSVPMGPDS